MSQQDDVAAAMRDRVDGERYWEIETGTIDDGRDSVRVVWGADAELPALTIDSDVVPYGWEIVQFGVGASSAIDGDRSRFVTLAEPEQPDERAIRNYEALARELTASELRDYVGVVHYGHSQTGWAELTDLNRSNVSERVNKAKRTLDAVGLRF